MAAKTKAQKNAELSAATDTAANEADKRADETLDTVNREADEVPFEQRVFNSEGHQLETEDGRPITLQMLTDWETGVTGNEQLRVAVSEGEQLKETVKELRDALAMTRNELDMQRTRARDAENREAWAKQNVPRDSMGMQKVVKEEPPIEVTREQAA